LNGLQFFLDRVKPSRKKNGGFKMSEYLFVPSNSANGQRKRIQINHFAQLFSEGYEDVSQEPPPPARRLQTILAGQIAIACHQIASCFDVPKPAAQVRKPEPSLSFYQRVKQAI